MVAVGRAAHPQLLPILKGVSRELCSAPTVGVPILKGS